MLDSSNKINTINLDFAQKLSFYIWKTSIKAKIIDGSTLKIFGMVIVDFQVENKVNKSRFFQKIFQIASTKVEIILKMFFLKISNPNVLFDKKSLTLKFYTTSKALLIIK